MKHSVLHNELTSSNLIQFQRRFRTFHDGLIHHVDINLFRQSTPKASIRIELEARDFEQSEDGQWVRLVFEIEDVNKYVLHQERDYCLNVIFRLNIAIFENEIFLDFSPEHDEPQIPADFEQYSSTSKTKFLITGERCFWYIKEIIIDHKS